MIFLFAYFCHKTDLKQRLQIIRYSLMKCANFFSILFLLRDWNKKYHCALLNQPKEDLLVAGQNLVTFSTALQTRAHMYFLTHSLHLKFKAEEEQKKL